MHPRDHGPGGLGGVVARGGVAMPKTGLGGVVERGGVPGRTGAATGNAGAGTSADAGVLNCPNGEGGVTARGASDSFGVSALRGVIDCDVIFFMRNSSADCYSTMIRKRKYVLRIRSTT